MEKEKQKRNKIIALSGQPVTGKGTNTKAIVEKLKLRGYAEENIHIISTGNEFRKFFEIIVDYIKNLENAMKLAELEKTPQIKAILENSEYNSAFKRATVQIKNSGIDLSNFTVEQANNLDELKSIRTIVDTLIDTKIEKLGKQINEKERPDEVWIFDSRLAFYNIPEAMSVRLTANKEVAGKRLLEDKSRGEEDSKYKTVEEAIEAREKRRIGEQERYIERYDVDLEYEENYNVIIDTSYSSVEDISDTILKCLDCYIENKSFSKKWVSPKTLLPLQKERDTLATALYTFEEMVESIEKNGYLPNKPIEIVEVDGRSYIIEGHHRNFASAYLNKTLVPIEVLAKDDEVIKRYSGGTARQRLGGLGSGELYGHEAIIALKEPEFSYNQIYPGIYEMLKQKENSKGEER